ncbi:dihydrolipoyl dehydrogenase [Candidatus Walczuchella monophlebidarum]|uniref:Dihydrolipoyl dehydrogenase n=1 Tax=Candidatus Walczuchella monophlebidarum TaxID=1415657 RepID=A0A068DRZ2_9FLAO|nr:dihydrolipoyl dehydrogenase [Candidatus Walczuchella monophlebidarum]AID37386.1 dihydrolipoamide dehydrogenase [Candidatus Walczuchella monophlebidarum]
MNIYDLIIIGSGPGGYVAAIRAAQLGFKTAIIEKYSTLGGTCLNVGCLPSKTLLDSSEYYQNALKNFLSHGIIYKDISLDFSKMMERKNQVVFQTCEGIKYLMNKNKISVYHGTGGFKTKNKIEIKSQDRTYKEISFRNAIIATGSKPSSFPYLRIDKNRIISSTEALSLKEIPNRLVIIGGGVIGIEIGSLYRRLGSETTVIEFSDRIVPFMDLSVSRELKKILTKSGIKFYLSTSVTSAESNGKEVIVLAKTKSGESLSFVSDYVLVAVGRKPNTKELQLAKIGLKTTSKGFIPVNNRLQSTCENIYAIGDVIGGAMLAHIAEEEGIFVVEHLSGQNPHINYELMPSVIYTSPEVATVGKTEEQLKTNKILYKSGQFPMRALGRTRACGNLDGFIKILADKNTDQVLGVHMIGARASDMIMEAIIAMEFSASAEDIARISHPHPSFTEAIREAALATTENRPIHI